MGKNEEVKNETVWNQHSCCSVRKSAVQSFSIKRAVWKRERLACLRPGVKKCPLCNFTELLSISQLYR